MTCSIEWKLVPEEYPLAYMSDYSWDGKKSDQVIAESKYGNRYLATFYEGILDSTEFKDWYDCSGNLIEDEIVRFLEIPL